VRSLCSQQTSGVIIDLSHGENLTDRDPLATVGSPLANTQQKGEMMVNTDVDGYT